MTASVTLGVAAEIKITLNGAGSATVQSPEFTATVGQSIIITMIWDVATASPITFNSATMSGASNGALTVIGTPTTLADSPSAGRTTYLQMAYLSNIGTAGSQTVTATMSGDVSGYVQMNVYEVAGLDTAGVYDNQNGATGSGTAPLVSLTTNSANAFIIAQCASLGSDPTAGSGYTGITQNNWYYYNNAEYDADGGAAGARNVDFATSSGAWAVKASSFKIPGAAGPAIPVFMNQYRQRAL